MSDITSARKLFDLLVSRDFDPEMLNSSGKPAPDPSEAEIFSFDFRARSGKDYGTVVIMLGDDHNLEIYCSDNVGRGMEGDDKNDWFAFLEQLKNFAVRNFMSFGIKNLNRLRYSMQGQAAIKEGLFESWTGNRTTSWNGAATEARLMIRHKKNISEGDARFRYIESLFIETADSERYKLPFTSLTAGRAMLEHVRQGGRPYDPRGNHIAEMVTELAVLSRFRRANQGQIFEGDTQQVVEQVQEYQSNLQRSLNGLGTRTGYATYFESWSPAEISEQDVVIESLKSLFVKQSIDTRIESALPLLAKIQQQGTAMKEANIFEAWAQRLVEGTWQTPDTPEKQAQLLELMSTELPVGADATNATEQLYDLLGDDELFDQLEELAERDANADARQVIYDRMQMLSNDPDVLKVIEQLQIDPTAEMNPPEATNPSDLEPMNESRLMDDTGETIDHILNRFKHEVKKFEQAGDLDDDLYHALFDYWNDAGEIPYGVQKARDGDPYEWVAQNLQSHLSGGGIVGGNPDEDYGIERESVMHGDYAEEKNVMRRLAGLPQETDEAATNETFIDPNSEYGVNAQGDYVDLKRDAKINANAKAAAAAKAFDTAIIGPDTNPNPGGRFFGAGGGSGGGSGGSGGSSSGENSAPMSGPIPTPPAGGSSSGAKPMGQMPAKNMGAVQTAMPKLPEDEMDEDYSSDSNLRSDKGLAGAAAGGIAGGALGSLAGPAGAIGGAALGAALGGAAGVASANKDIDTAHNAAMDKQSAKQTKFVPVGPYNTDKPPPVIAVDTGKYPGLVPLQNKDQPKDTIEDASPLAGQYGHSGKMKAVDKDLSFLDRLKELSGMKK